MSDAPGSEELLKRTFLTLKKTQSRLAELESARSEPIAIVGMACRFPGGSSDPEKLWQFLERGGNANAPVPPERWEASRFYDPSPDATGKTHAARAHFLSESIDGFDAPFFGISAKEAISLDPQQRLLLEVTWEALEDAGIDSRSLRGSQTGVYVGISADDYTQAHRHSGRPDLIDAYALTGTCFAPAAGRISYTFGFEGPSMAIDTACSSSLVAVHLAAQSLRSRESDLALAAGVNLILSPIFHISSTRLGTISPDGQCKTFDASADGYGRGEGCGVVLLKRLSDALAAGDRIHALLRGSAVNQDGRSNGLTAPNGLAQEKVIQRALANAGVLPADVDYIEVHGTGTPLGDPIEVESIGRIMRNVRTNADPVRLSTIKTNIGHLEAGAGVAGLIKTIQCLRHEAIPPHLHLKNPSAHIPWDQYPISVSREGTPWPRGPRVRRAGVSSFGFSGTNAHVVLEEAPPMAARRNDETRPLHVLPISARSAEGLEELKGRYVELLETSDEPIADICFTAGAGRTHFAHRLAVKGATTADVLRALRETNGSSAHNRPRIAFLFTGQGSQYAGMGRTLYESEPRFRAAFDECAAHFDGELVALLYGASASDDELRQTRFTQPAIFAVEYALAKLWASWGVEPDLLCGHSIGEYAAAVIGGVLSVADAMRLVTARGRLMQALPDGGAMAAVAATAREVEPFLDGTEVAIAAINAPADVVLSGPAAEVARICEALRARNIASQPLRVSHAFHSTLMDPMIDAFRTVASNVDYRSAQLPIVSTVTGRKASANELSNADYWTRQIGATVRFADAASALAAEGADVMLEIGAMPILTGLAAKTLGEGTYLPSLTRRDDEWKRMLTTLAALYTRGVEVDWRAFDAPWNRVRVALPSYPFQRKSYYLQPIVDSASGHITEHHPYLGQRIESPRVVLHETTFTSAEPAFLKEHQIFGRIISPAAAHVSMALAATGTSALEDVAFTAPLVIDDGERRTVQTIVDREAGTFELLSRGGAQWISHCTGRIGTMVPASNPLPPDVQRRCTDAMSHDDFYALIERAGYSTGPNFQCVATIAKGEDEALCSVTPTVTIDDGAIHPGLIDSVLQTVLPACDRSASQMLTGDSVLIPLHMGAVRVHRSLASGLLCHTRVSVASGHVKCTIRGYDPTGELALEIDDFLLKQTDRATLYRELRTEDRSLLYTTEWIETTKSGGDERPDYLIFGEHGWVDAISATLRERGSDCVEAVPGLTLEEIAPSRWALDPLAPAQVGELLTNWLRERNGPARIVFLWNGAPAAPELRTASAIEEQERFLCSALLNVVHALTANPSARLWVVTQNAQAVLADDPPADAVPATLWGFGRAIAGESPELWGGLVDVEKTRSATSVATLVSVLDRGAGEQQLAIRKGSAYAARLMHAARPARKTTPRDGYYLATGARHTLDDLSFQPRPRVAPAAHEVEVEIHAAGLNFRDVLNALGQYPGEAGLMGFEAVGIVTAAGSDVTRLKAGDAVIVMAAPGCIGSFITVDARFVLPKPASMTFEEAVTLPATFLTAWYALHILGRISSKDRILIHAAAGGVGLAALQIARAAGAEVFATAGSNEKRDYVRSLLGSGGVDHVMSSRTLDFANELAQRTHGAGVTMVLNSLNGEFIARSFEVLAPHGRFLEMGKIGIWDEERVRAHDATIEYHPFDLAAVSRENP
ncbi:MAG: beta-ketoacyl synthase N-terminal-like domain-containing protein, partial [Thermoanaerobaculia bacterium]